MKPRTILSVVATALVAATLLAAAQQPRGQARPPADLPDRAATRAATLSGIVAAFLTNPDGDTDGLQLDDGNQVRFRPEAAPRLAGVIQLKDRIKVEGWTRPGEAEIHAATIRNEATGTLVIVDRPPPELEGGGEPDRSVRPDQKPQPRPIDPRPPTKRDQPDPGKKAARPQPVPTTADVRPANPAPGEAPPVPTLHAEPGPIPGFVRIPGGSFDMGDHHGFGSGGGHPNDELPIHRVRLDAFAMATTPTTNQQYCDYLNAALASRQIQLKDGQVFSAEGQTLPADTHDSDEASSISRHDGTFVVSDFRANHPVVCIRWEGAAAYCNWLSQKLGFSPLYDLATGACDLAKPGIRLPSEAEWEYAARGGLVGPYYNFPWGDEPDPTRAAWPESQHPFHYGAYPWTTPVGLHDGTLKRKADLRWPGPQETYQTGNGVNGFGLHDMAGNVWQWVNDWYDSAYYAFSPSQNPPGPDLGRPMPDGKPYRVLRGGNWYNGEWGHSRVSNRDPAYYRGPDDPDHRWYHIGFRVVLKSEAPKSEPAPGAASAPARAAGRFVLSSPVVKDGQPLPTEFTGDGAGVSPPLLWSGAPAGTKSFALIMHHNAPDGVKWYWTLYDIPASVTSLANGVRGIGTTGNNGINRDLGYAPPQSKGPGEKTYTFTVYALSAPPRLSVPPAQVNRDILLAAMSGSILGSADLNVTYSRGDAGADRDAPPPPGEDRPPPRALEAPGRPAAVPGGHTVGLFQNDLQTAPGYTLFAPKHHTLIYLIDNEGRAVHTWKSQYEPGQSVYLLENGHLLHCCFTKNRGFTSGGEGGRLEEFDWEGNLVWEFDYSSDQHLSHHNVKPLPNGNILVLAVEKKSHEEALAAGFDPQMMRDDQLFPEYLIEVEPTRPSGGKIVWEWHVWDHLIQDFDASKANYGEVAAHPERIDVDANGRPTPAFWNHGNSIAYNPKLDQIILSARGCNEVWVIDHGTTTKEAAGSTGGKAGKGGDLLYRWGNPAAYDRGSADDRELFQQHDAQWIPDGHPGAGHILIFNNGLDRGYSTVEEIAPPVDANGRYPLETGKPFGPTGPVWRYQAQNPTAFYSAEISGAQRLPNGNTLICAGVQGTFFEVTPAGETVWRYVNPVVHNGILAQGESSGLDHRGHNWNAVFKVHRYPPDHPGLSGKDLTPLGPIEQPSALAGKTGFHDQAPEGPPVGPEGRGDRPPRDGNRPDRGGSRP